MALNTIYKNDLFLDKTALITGGGSGIGLRTARELLVLGANVVLAGRNTEKLAGAREAILRENPTVQHKLLELPCNIREEESVQACVRMVLEKFGHIHLLVNNAGGQFPLNAEKIKTKGWKAVLDTNLTGGFLVSREVFNACYRENSEDKKEGGAIVNVLMNMFNGFPLMAHSAAARAGMDNLTKSLATEWGRYGVRVNSVAPGIIKTSGLDTYDPEFKKFALAARKNNQTYRLGSEAEISAAILYLLSPAAAFTTGETLRVDGGESIYSPMYPPVEHELLPAFDDI